MDGDGMTTFGAASEEGLGARVRTQPQRGDLGL